MFMKKKGKQQYMYFKSWDFEDFKSFQKETTHKFNPIRNVTKLCKVVNPVECCVSIFIVKWQTVLQLKI